MFSGLLHCFAVRNDGKKKRSHKPGSVSNLSFISTCNHLQALSFDPPSLPEPGLADGIFELSTHEVYPKRLLPNVAGALTSRFHPYSLLWTLRQAQCPVLLPELVEGSSRSERLFSVALVVAVYTTPTR